jgi:hypothetical protein
MSQVSISCTVVSGPCPLVPPEATSPVGAGQSTSRTLNRPSDARQSMAREHPNPILSSFGCRLWRLSPSRTVPEPSSRKQAPDSNGRFRPHAVWAAQTPFPDHPPITHRRPTISGSITMTGRNGSRDTGGSTPCSPPRPAPACAPPAMCSAPTERDRPRDVAADSRLPSDVDVVELVLVHPGQP